MQDENNILNKYKLCHEPFEYGRAGAYREGKGLTLIAVIRRVENLNI